MQEHASLYLLMDLEYLFNVGFRISFQCGFYCVQKLLNTKPTFSSLSCPTQCYSCMSDTCNFCQPTREDMFKTYGNYVLSRDNRGHQEGRVLVGENTVLFSQDIAHNP